MFDSLACGVPDHWEVTTLGDICRRGGGNIQTGPFGSQLHASDYVPVGVPSIMPINIGDNRINAEGIARITEKDADRLSQHRVRVGDIIYSRRGDVERRALIRVGEEGWLCGTGCLKVRLGSGIVDPAFASYQLGTPATREWIVRHAVGATMPNLNTSIMSAVPFVLPPLSEQKAIASVLGALDDKIELNRRMNAALETMAQALFTHWIESRDVEERSVQELIDEGIMLIGDGYRAKNSEMESDGLPFVRAGNLKTNGLDLEGAEFLSARGVAAAGHKLGQVGDVAFTSKGTVGRITRVSERTGAFVYSPQVCFWRTICAERLNPHVLYRWMSSDAFLRQVAAVSTQTDMAPYVSLRDQRRMSVALPAPSAQREFAEQLSPIDEMIASNAAQSRTLATMRDTLLPKLLSGRMSAEQIERRT